MHTNLKVIKEGYYFWSIMLKDRPLATIFQILHLLSTTSFNPFKLKDHLSETSLDSNMWRPIQNPINLYDGEVLRKQLTAESHKLVSKNSSIIDFDSALNTPRMCDMTSHKQRSNSPNPKTGQLKGGFTEKSHLGDAKRSIKVRENLKFSGLFLSLKYGHCIQKETSTNEHEWTSIEYLNILHYNRAQKKL